MRLSERMQVVVSGYGMPFSMVPKKFDGEICVVDWACDDSDDQWVSVKYDGCAYTVHACQCTPLPKEKK